MHPQNMENFPLNPSVCLLPSFPIQVSQTWLFIDGVSSCTHVNPIQARGVLLHPMTDRVNLETIILRDPCSSLHSRLLDRTAHQGLVSNFGPVLQINPEDQIWWLLRHNHKIINIFARVFIMSKGVHNNNSFYPLTLEWQNKDYFYIVNHASWIQSILMGVEKTRFKIKCSQVQEETSLNTLVFSLRLIFFGIG